MFNDYDTKHYKHLLPKNRNLRLKDKSQAINLMAQQFEEHLLEPGLKPEFIESLKASENEKTIKVSDFVKRYSK
ncbi:MAG: DUF2683 family protein [Nitrososphaerota archaeon]|nr:DUF2683 family protein [Nitrososphaerota archaeon]